MSRTSELYHERLQEMGEALVAGINVALSEDISEMTEKEKCLNYGISCSFGICDECDVAERS